MTNERKIVERIPVKGEEFKQSDNEGWMRPQQNSYELLLWSDGTTSWQLAGQPADTTEEEMHYQAYERQTKALEMDRPWQF